MREHFERTLKRALRESVSHQRYILKNPELCKEPLENAFLSMFLRFTHSRYVKSVMRCELQVSKIMWSKSLVLVHLKKDEDFIRVLLRVKGPQALDPINILVEEEMELMTAFHRAAATKPLLSY